MHPFLDYERRYPFLYKPLVEFALRLPPTDGVVRPLAGKWVLRRAMRGLLPDLVRTRVSKGSVGSRMLWSLDHERKVIEWMLQDPILAHMGCVDAARLREAYSEARLGRLPVTIGLFKALALETWLRIRDGRWPVRFAAGSRSSKSSSTLNLQGVV
jgi:asparagine synthase (glutamine-hydrolysing)